MSIREINWRGPRPLGGSDRLYGRSSELRELRDRCQTYDIVEVTAPSGVGKTSFVTAGGAKVLAEAGFYVPPIVKWSEALKHPKLAGLDETPAYAEILYRIAIGLDGGDLDPDDRGSAEAVTAAASGRKMVVILDQLDELLRYKRNVGAAMLRLAGAAARDSPVPHIVIARTEFRERLAPVEARGATVWNLLLGEITGRRAITRIITEPVTEAKVEITAEATAQIAGWWEEARTEANAQVDEGVTGGDIGLLHLQALLVSFKRWAVARGHGDDVVIDESLLAQFAETVDVPGTRRGGRLCEAAIVGHVGDVVAQATAAPTVIRDGEQVPLRWVNGPRVVLSRIAAALSAGGYKVPQTTASLIPIALADELTQRKARLLGGAAARGLSEKALGEHLAAHDVVVSGEGIAAGWSNREVVREMIDSLVSILASLSDENANVLRLYNVTDEPVYELVHDGIGAALERWALAFQDRPVSELARIIARPGGAMTHDLAVETFTNPVDARYWGIAREEADGKIGLENLRWDSYYVGPPAGADHRLRLVGLVIRGATFTGAAFVACDLEGVTFVDCEFHGAAFINCALNSVTFSACALPNVSINDCHLSAVTFAGSEVGGLDQLSIKNCVSSTVDFRDNAEVSGLAVRALGGGIWTFSGCALRHLMLDAATPVGARLEGSSLSHATLAGPVTLEHGDCAVSYVEVVSSQSSSEPS